MSRVALVAPIAPLRGGIAHHAGSLVEALGRRGHVARVLSYRRQYPRLLFPGAREEDEQQPPPRVPVARELTSLSPLRWLAGVRALRAFAPELVVVAWWNAALLGPAAAVLGAARAEGWRTVLLAHNTASHEGVGGLLDALAWPVLTRLCDGVLVHGAEDARRLQRRYPNTRVAAHAHPLYDRFLKLRLPRAEARRQLNLRHDDEVALCLGNVRSYKGVDVAVRAVAQLAGRRPRLKLVVAGEVYAGARVELEAALRHVEEGRVQVLDRYLSDDELASYVSAADVLLAPHRRASHSGVVQVAKAFGLPVIASRVGGLPETVDPKAGDRLFPVGDSAALAMALDDALTTPSPRRAPREDATSAGWDSLADALLRLGKLS